MNRVDKMAIFSKRHISIALSLIFLTLTGCFSKPLPPKRSYYTIAYPSRWQNIPLYGTEQNVTGFSSELLYGIAKEAGITIRLVMKDVNSFSTLLERGEVDAVLTAMPVNNITEKFFDFTNPYFMSGTVIVVRATSPYKTSREMKNAEIAFDRSEGVDIVIGARPSWLLRPYDNPFHAIDDILEGKVDGMILNFINAKRLQQSLYRSKLRILSPPLVTQNIRLAVYQGENHELIELLNEGIHKFVESSKYAKLLEYWGIQSQLKASE